MAADAAAKSTGPVTARAKHREKPRDPYQEDYERAKAAGFPQPGQERNPAQAGAPSAGNPGPGALLIVLGAVSIIVTIFLQNVKITLDGVSASASQVNGICQSSLGQFGQALSSGFGNGTPQDVCGRAATVEDWKGITLWLGLALIAGGIGMIGRQAGWLPSRGPRNITAWAASQESPAATLARAERAEAEAARLRAQAAQMQAGRPVQPGPQPGGQAAGGWHSPEAPPTFQRGS